MCKDEFGLVDFDKTHFEPTSAAAFSSLPVKHCLSQQPSAPLPALADFDLDVHFRTSKP